MSKVKLLTALMLFVLAVHPSFAEDPAKMIGTWKLITFETEIKATGAIAPTMGSKPTGYAIFTPERRAMFVLTGEGRKVWKSNEDSTGLLASLVSYTGIYRIEGDKWITKVDVAWRPDWVGTEQSRSFTLEGDRLQVVTPWMVRPDQPEKGESERYLLTFERVK